MDIFISYKKERAPQAQRLAATLEAYGYDVWWDYELAVGPGFRDQIERKLEQAKCVIVLWCSAAVQSRFVRSEAERAEKRGKLLQAYLEWVEPPLGFEESQGHSLVHWRGEPEGEALDNLLAAIESAIGTRKVLPNILRLIADVAPLEAIAPVEVNSEDRVDDTSERVSRRFGDKLKVSTEAIADINETAAHRRWTIISESLDHRDYKDFLDVFPKDPESFDAKRHQRQLKDWSEVDATDARAVEEFIEKTDRSSQLFSALRSYAFRTLQDIEGQEFKQKQERQQRIDEIKLKGVEVVVPVLGESITEATVGVWFFSQGEHVKKDQVLCELETDKVAVEVSAEFSGTIAEISATEGDTVKVGGSIARIFPDKPAALLEVEKWVGAWRASGD